MRSPGCVRPSQAFPTFSLMSARKDDIQLLSSYGQGGGTPAPVATKSYEVHLTSNIRWLRLFRLQARPGLLPVNGGGEMNPTISDRELVRRMLEREPRAWQSFDDRYRAVLNN